MISELNLRLSSRVTLGTSSNAVYSRYVLFRPGILSNVSSLLASTTELLRWMFTMVK